MQIISHEWQPSSDSLPTRQDFDPWGGDLDAQTASHNFFGLTRSEAYDRFLENPTHYQEDFMFMGGAAFAYYYPVIERYLLEQTYPENQEAWILAHCIKQQFEVNATSVEHLRPRILALAKYVMEHPSHYDDDQEQLSQIATAWGELERRLTTKS